MGEDPADATRMRISDADRDKAASVLGGALAEGRITADEHAERLDGIYASRTQAEILPLVSDLPGATAALQAPTGTVDVHGAGGEPEPARRTARMVAIFSTHTRRGLWRVPHAISAVNVFGHTELDLRDAVLPGKEVRVKAICVLGDLRITVPPEMHVIDSGWALFGGREFPPDTPESASADAPVLRVSGVSILGLATVRRENRERRRLEQTRASAEIPAQDPEVPGNRSTRS
jgi:Domain of unknown function (DUF1707)/Cell wall-active antibiotics response 4TMS YvqF